MPFSNILFRNLILLVWLSFCLSVPITLNAQQHGIKFKSLSTEEGLSSSLTWCITQDHHGFIWIGTNDGLNVYNGYDFKIYRHQKTDTNSISHNYVSSLIFDSKNRLWAGTLQGLDLYDAEQDHFIHVRFSNNPHTRDINIHWIYEDQQNTIWAGTSEGLHFYNEVTKQLDLSTMPAKQGISSHVTAFLQDKSGNYWLGTEQGLWAYSPEKKHYTTYLQDPGNPSSLADNKINYLFQDSRGLIWIATPAGLDQYLPDKNGFKHFATDQRHPNAHRLNNIRNIAEGRDGNLWIGTSEAGVKKLDITTQTFEVFVKDTKDPYSLLDNAVKGIFKDEMGGLWVSTFRGISFADHYQIQFDHFEHKEYDPQSLTDDYITAMFRDSQDNIWSGNRYGISLLDPNTDSFTHYKHDPSDKHSISDGAIISIDEDTDGNLWCADHLGVINKFDRRNKSFIRYTAEPENSSSIRKKSNFVLCTRDGNVWVSFVHGISLLDKKNNAFIHFPMPDSIKGSEISFLYEDSKRNLLVVSWGGIYTFNKSKRTFSLYKAIPQGLFPLQTTDIYEDKHNNVWIGSAYKGLLKYNPEKETLKIYTNKRDLPEIHIKGILEDKEGNLWLSSGNGLCRFDPNTGDYKMYGLADGLKNFEFNLRDCAQSADGKMYFGGKNGISAFHPHRILKNPNPPKVVITNFQLFNKTVPIEEDSPLNSSITETKHIELDYKQSVLSFEFVALNFNSPEKNQYAYRMLGFEDEWNYSGTRRHATYTNLPPGKTYTFQVKASNNDGVWNSEGTSVEIYIKPPFWTTWWFYSLLACFAIGALYGIYRWRTRQLYLQRRELERMVKERTEEVEAQKEALTLHAGHLASANKEIKHKNKKILRQSNRLKALDQLKSQFLTNISHEFRTPLTLILVPLEEMLSAAQADGDTRGQLSVMNRNAKRLLQLINQLLDLSKLEHGGVPLELTSKNVVSFLRSVALSFEPMAKKYGIDYQFFCSEDKIVTAFDADKLEKIMYNLISNAFKFTPGGGSIKVSVNSLELTETGGADEQVKHQKYFQFTVSDTGSGISADHLPNIFDRFYQVEPSLVRKSDGTGIGLALTKELVDLHGGKIKVSSEPGQGTCFTVMLPLAEQAPDEALQPEVQNIPIKLLHAVVEEEEDQNDVENQESVVTAVKEDAPLLLIVEDNKDLRHQIKRVFSGEFRVEEAADGVEGWEKAIELIPDFIISDVMMPVRDGLALCNQLKNSPATSHIPTILLSARIDGEEAGLRIGADDYITKPFNASALALKVKNLLETRQKFREAICRELGINPLTASPESHDKVNPQDKLFLEQASDIALKHLSNADFDMEVFYRELGMSRTLVYKKLKSLTGLGPNEFIRRIRLNKASRLLLEGKGNVSEVMLEVGFSHRSYFVKCFKNEFGHLPSEHASCQNEITAQPQE